MAILLTGLKYIKKHDFLTIILSLVIVAVMTLRELLVVATVALMTLSAVLVVVTPAQNG